VAIVSVIGSSFCHQEKVCTVVAKKLDYTYLSDAAILQDASTRFSVPVAKLERAIYQTPSVFNKFTHEKERFISYLRVTLAEIVTKDNLVLDGFATLLFPKNLSHVLRVCLVATHSFRTQVGASEGGLQGKEIEKALKKNDQEFMQWSQYLYQLGPNDKSLYDLIVPMHSTSVEDAVALIAENAAKPALASTKTALQAVKDFQLSGQVGIALAAKGHDVGVTCDAGTVTMVINKYTMRLDALEQELVEIARGVPGVQKAETRVGSGFHQPNIYFNLDAEMPQKVLLVDDEKDFVHVLSERLKARSFESAIAYNGEEALSILETDEPDVMVLDLKMPGIDGIEVLRKVRKSHPDTQVIILTGHGSEREEAVARELGAFAYLHKPVDIEVLAKTMKEAYRKMEQAKKETND
jgi:two-component system response regulator CpxR